MELPARSQSLSASLLSQIKLPTNISTNPLQRMASDVSLILDISLTFNQSLEVLSAVQNEKMTVLLRNGPMAGSSRATYSAHPSGMRDTETEPVEYLVYEHMATRLTFKLLTSTLCLVGAGKIKLRMWYDWGSMCAGMVLGRIIPVHPGLARVLTTIISSLLSLHPATLLYACLLYIHEAVVMATEMDPELIVA